MVPDGPPPRRRQNRRRHWTSQDDANIATAYEQGATLKDLAAQHAVSRWAISAILVRKTVTPRYRVIGPHELVQAIQQYESGKSCAVIAQALGVAPNTVRKELQEAGVRLRDSHGRDK